MVVCATDLQADVIFAIEGTAVTGAYKNDLITNYIVPSLEYFSPGKSEEVNYMSENANCLYGVVVYYAADCLPNPSSDTIGPFSSTEKLLLALDKLDLIGGKGESHANVAEGLATSLHCFDELQQKRDPSVNAQKHCVLVCNSPPYLLPVMESQTYSGKNTEQLAVLFQERGINLSIISPRKIPSLYKLFEKAGGDLGTSQTKNYAKDPRHLVLLKGYSLKERPLSPPGGGAPGINPNAPPNQLPNPVLPPNTSLASPLPNSSDSPIPGGGGVVQGPPPNQNMLNAAQAGVVAPNQVYRPNNPQGMVGMVNTVRGGMMGSNQYQNPQLQAPPYVPPGITARAPPRGWMMPPQQPQQRPPFIPQQNQPGGNANQGSALIAQLTQPPSSMPSPVNQFPQMNTNSPMSAAQQQQQQQQQQQMQRMGMMSAAAQQQAAQQQQQQQVQQQQQQNQMQQNPMGVGGPNPITSGIQPASNPNQVVAPPNQVITSQAPMPNTAGQQMNPGRQTIWNGLLEWVEKPKNPTDSQKIIKNVPCSVSATVKDGEPELKADGWPSKLIMQIMPKQLIGNIGGVYLKNSKSVLFHPTPCEALDSLTKVMSTGFAGCVHFTSTTNTAACDIKVLILLYTSEKRAYLGFIPNDQVAFVDRLRKVIQQQKSTQMMRQATGNPQVGGAMVGGPSQMPISNPGTPQSAPQQQQQQGMMMSQTNTMAMGGGQITQNVSAGGQPGLHGQNVPPGAGAMQQRLRMPGIQTTGNQMPNQPQQLQQQQQPQPPQQQPQQPGGGPQQPNPNSGNMMGAPRGQQQPFANQLEVERQANLDKINHLKQTLEAAQQQEQQYKNQLERISHMKTAQLQEALQMAQQQEMQYKLLDQQRLSNQGNPQQQQQQQQQAANQQQQQRMMRPVMSNNPGLRTLLQQQPQYRQQLMGMHQMGGTAPRNQMGQQIPNAGNNQQVNFDDVSNFDFM